jgi:hypothetical protein
MSDTPEAGPASGDQGFAPPDGGFRAQPPAPGYSPPPGYGPAPGYASQAYSGGYHGYYGPPMLRQQTSGMAVAGMVLGIVSMVLFWASLLGPLLAVLGIVFSSIGLSQSSKPGQTGIGMAVAGLVCSVITLAVWVTLVILIASIIA